MAYYEMLYILSPDLSDEERESLVNKFKDFIGKNKGEVVSEAIWGLRSLTYPINKKEKGYYILDYIDVPESLIKEIKYFIKVNEGFLRAMILKKKRKEPIVEKKGEEENV